MPVPVYRRQGEDTAVLQFDPRSGHQVVDGARYQHLVAACVSGDIGGDIHGYALERITFKVDLSCMYANAVFDVPAAQKRRDRLRAFECSRRAVEGRRKAVRLRHIAGRAITVDPILDGREVGVSDLRRGGLAVLDPHGRRQNPAGLLALRRVLQKTEDGTRDLVPIVTDKGQMVGPRQLDVLRPGISLASCRPASMSIKTSPDRWITRVGT